MLLFLCASVQAEVKNYHYLYAADFASYALNSAGYVKSGTLSGASQSLYCTDSVTAVIKAGSAVSFERHDGSSGLDELYLRQGVLNGDQSFYVNSVKYASFKANATTKFNLGYVVSGTIVGNESFAYGPSSDINNHQVELKAGTVVNFSSFFGYYPYGWITSGTLSNTTQNVLYYSHHAADNRSVLLTGGTNVSFVADSGSYSNYGGHLSYGYVYGTQSVLYGPGRSVTVAGGCYFNSALEQNIGYLAYGQLYGSQYVYRGYRPYGAIYEYITPSAYYGFSSDYGGCLIVY